MLYHFHDYSLNSDRRELRQDEQLITIEPKVFQILLHLLEHRDRVIPKGELLDQCWPDTFVSESVLNRCLTRLSKAVQSERTSPQVIKTLHRQGYRFVAKVTVNPVQTNSTPPTANAMYSTTAKPKIMIVDEETNARHFSATLGETIMTRQQSAPQFPVGARCLGIGDR